MFKELEELADWRMAERHLAGRKRRTRITEANSDSLDIRHSSLHKGVSMCASVYVASSPTAVELFVAAGILRDQTKVPAHLRLFASQADRVLREVHALVERGEMISAAAADFTQLLADACAHVMCHPIVASNRYLERFSQGVIFAQARHEVQQFSVFAAQFDVAQAKL